MYKQVCFALIGVLSVLTLAYTTPVPRFSKQDIAALLSELIHENEVEAAAAEAPDQASTVDNRAEVMRQLKNLPKLPPGGQAEGNSNNQELSVADKRAQYQYICFDKWRRVKLCSGRV